MSSRGTLLYTAAVVDCTREFWWRIKFNQRSFTKKRSFWVSWKKPAHFFTPHMRSTFLPLLHHTHILKQTYFHPLPTLRKRCWCVVFRTKAITRGGLYLLCECKIREKVNYDWSISFFRQIVARTVLETLRVVTGQTEDVTAVLNVMNKLADDVG